jgi:ankyrin repeat protein
MEEELDPENVNYKDTDGYTRLMKACAEGEIENATILINEMGANVNIQDIDGNTALMQLIIFNNNNLNFENLVVLLAPKTDFNLRNNENLTVIEVAKNYMQNSPKENSTIRYLEHIKSTIVSGGKRRNKKSKKRKRKSKKRNKKSNKKRR